MSECTCHKNYTEDVLIPQVGVITDIRQETPDVKTFRVNAPEGGKLFEHMPGQCAMLCVPGVSEGMFSITSSPTNKEYQEHLDLIAGLPGEDLESFHKSFDDVFAMEPEQLQLGFLKVLRGTKIHRMAQQYGIVCHDKAPYEVLSTPWLPYKDLLLLKGVEEMVELYYNSHQYEKTLEEILKNYGSPFAFFEELSEFYDRKGYSKISHSRMARYEILREFISEKDWADPVYDQCMIFDLYARERLKSRPTFAADRSPYKEQLREYEKIYGKQVHIEIFTRDSQPVFVLFDYARRNPLTNDAHVEVLG